MTLQGREILLGSPGDPLAPKDHIGWFDHVYFKNGRHSNASVPPWGGAIYSLMPWLPNPNHIHTYIHLCISLYTYIYIRGGMALGPHGETHSSMGRPPPPKTVGCPWFGSGGEGQGPKGAHKGPREVHKALCLSSDWLSEARLHRSNDIFSIRTTCTC